MNPTLQHWHDITLATIDAVEEFERVTGAPFDGPLLNPVMLMSEAYDAVVSQILGDESGWLDYYKNHCDMGRNPGQVTADGEEILLDSLEKLAKLMKV